MFFVQCSLKGSYDDVPKFFKISSFVFSRMKESHTGAVFTKYFILPQRVLLNSSKSSEGIIFSKKNYSQSSRDQLLPRNREMSKAKRKGGVDLVAIWMMSTCLLTMPIVIG